MATVDSFEQAVTECGGRRVRADEWKTTGITIPHFEALLAYCKKGFDYVPTAPSAALAARYHMPSNPVSRGVEQLCIAVRKTKPACAKWIDARYPAKPGSLFNVKCSPLTGFVTCVKNHPKGVPYDKQRQEAWDAGYYVLEYLPDPRRPGEMCFLAIRGKDHLAYHHFPKEEILHATGETTYGTLDKVHQTGQVIDGKSKRPLTGDYDIMWAFPLNNPASTRVHLVGGTEAKGKRDEEDGLLYDRNNPWIKQLIPKLNEAIGDQRIMHSFHDLKFRPDEKNDDGCTVFHPAGAFWVKKPQLVEFSTLIGRTFQQKGDAAAPSGTPGSKLKVITGGKQ